MSGGLHLRGCPCLTATIFVSPSGIPRVNEHISGLEKLLKGVPTFTPPNAPSGQRQRRSGGWWFKSTSPHGNVWGGRSASSVLTNQIAAFLPLL